MNSTLRWRIALTLIVLIISVAYCLPSIPGMSQSPLGKLLPSDKVSLGLDLKGGIHLTLGVDVDTAVVSNLAATGQDLRSLAREKEIIVLRPRTIPGHKLDLTLIRSDQREAFEDLLQHSYGQVLTIESATTQSDGKVEYILGLNKKYLENLEKMTIDQAVKTIRNRIDQFGVAEPDIRRQEGNRIQVQLPGLQDPERAIKIIGKTAHLEFKLVDDKTDPAQAAKGILPPDRELSVLMNRMPNGQYSETPIVLYKDPLMTGENITDASTNFDQFNTPYVTLSFNARGARIFERITGDNVNKRMAIVLDGKVYSAPAIREKISGGRASITGHFTTNEARDLAIVLRAGALPAPVKILEQRTVGPSLGQESINKGITAAFIGLVVVFGFMIIYYGFGGMVADVVLLFNIVLILAALAAFGATLTLPGIAGIILTIGMAVDANVIIFERIREDRRAGLNAVKAVQEGYSRATLTIMDANVTTIIAAVILYQFGTGPIRGFAITLILGILSSMFTAIFVSRVLFDIYLSKRHDANLSI